MTKPEAKAIGIRLWTYLSENPSLTPLAKAKEAAIQELGLPRMQNNCPLCEYFKIHKHYNDTECPLFSNSDYGCKYYDEWLLAKTLEDKSFYAKQILEAIKSWNIE